MDRQDFFDRLEFQDQYIVDQKIEPKWFFKDIPFVFDGNKEFTSDRNRPKFAFPEETPAVNAFD